MTEPSDKDLNAIATILIGSLVAPFILAMILMLGG